jgi:hypothetical protein
VRWLIPLLLLTPLACTEPKPAPPAPKPERALGPAPDPDKVRRAEARFRYRDGLKHLEAKRLDEALASFRDAERLDDAYADPHRMIAGVLLRQGDRPGACASMQRYVELADQRSVARVAGGDEPKVRELANTPEALRADVLEATCGTP